LIVMILCFIVIEDVLLLLLRLQQYLFKILYKDQ
jgi:hypothetical protein